MDLYSALVFVCIALAIGSFGGYAAGLEAARTRPIRRRVGSPE